MSFDEFGRSTLGQVLIVMTEGKPDVRQLTHADVKERIAWIRAMREGKASTGETPRVGDLPPEQSSPTKFGSSLSFLERRLLGL